MFKVFPVPNLFGSCSLHRIVKKVNFLTKTILINSIQSFFFHLKTRTNLIALSFDVVRWGIA